MLTVTHMYNMSYIYMINHRSLTFTPIYAPFRSDVSHRGIRNVPHVRGSGSR